MVAFSGERELEGKRGIARVGIASFVIFSLILSPVSPLTQNLVKISGYGSIGISFVRGLPSADVYVVRNDSAKNYVTINGSYKAQVLETNTNPVTAINDAITHWVPTNGKIVTNGTMPDWSGTVTPSHGNFTWEAWKTEATQVSSSASWLAGVNIRHSFVTINNFTYIGRSSTAEIGIRCYDTNGITVENCSITGCDEFEGILIIGGVGHSIRFNNVSFNENEATQICFNGVSDSVISNNTVDAGGDGQCIGVFGHPTTQSNVNITSNVLKNWGQSILLHGIYTSGTAYSYIYNNTFLPSSTTAGVDLQIKSYCNTIFNNTFDGSLGASWAYGPVQQSAGDWNSPNGTRFYNNTIKNYATGGIYMPSGYGFSVGNLTIANNTLINCGTGIQLVSDSATVYDQNDTIIGNSFTTGNYAIRMGYDSPHDYSESIKILNNTITGYTFGIWEGAHALNPVIEFNAFSSVTTAIYQPSLSATYRFNVGLTGYHMLNVTVVGGGSTSPSGLGWQYASGSIASAVWTPSTGYARQDISIDGINQSTTISPLSVNMTTDHVVIAYFVKSSP